MSEFPSPLPPPALNIPPSDSIVKVSVIDSTARFKGVPVSLFFEPPIKGYDTLDCPAYCFLVEHGPSNTRLLFDLGVMKDWKNSSPVFVKSFEENGWGLEITKNVSEILVEHGVPLESISTIVWSHWHWDHTGDPSLFPPSTSLTVGPGFTEGFIPGYPTNPNGGILESAYKAREVVEISFDKDIQLGNFRAFDYFGDGSFYLLDSPGHAVGHICGLARTTPDTFVFMGADICHHGGQMRPTQYLPLPQSISPNPFKPGGFPCPGSLLLDVHPHRSATEPFFHVSTLPDGKSMSSDPPEAEKSIRKLGEFDAHPNVFTVIAHDVTLLGIIDFFPRGLNDWYARGYREQAMWGFLGDFKGAVEYD